MKKCSECVNFHACELWNMGDMENTNADHCTLYETIKDTAAYYLGLRDGRPEWIPVEDELPVSCEKVLVTVENDNDCADYSAPTEYSVKIADYGNAGDGDGHWYIELAETSDRVTAWMPMPKFYRYDEIVGEAEE